MDWRAFVLAVSFGYIFSVFPIILSFLHNSLSSSTDVFETILFRAEVYLIFAIIAFTSVGTLLGNSNKIDLPVVLACASNMVFGLIMFGFFSEFDALNTGNPQTVSNVVQFGKWCWVISFLIFVASHLRPKGGVSP